jgi:hypothetical protein
VVMKFNSRTAYFYKSLVCMSATITNEIRYVQILFPSHFTMLTDQFPQLSAAFAASPYGADFMSVAITIVAAIMLYCGHQAKSGPDLKFLGMMFVPPTILSLHLSKSRQDEKIRHLLHDGIKQSENLELLKKTISLVRSTEKMTGIPQQRNISRDLRAAIDRNEHHIDNHTGVRNSNGYAPSRNIENGMIRSTMHLEDNASFYDHSSTTRTQQKTNIPNGHSYNAVEASDPDGRMTELDSRKNYNGSQGRSVAVDYNAPQAKETRIVQPIPPKEDDALARLFKDTAVSADKSDGDVENMKEGRVS